MKSLITFLFLCLIQMTTMGQSTNNPSWDLTTSSSLGQSFHYNAPVRFIVCIEGCPVRDQRPGFFQNYQLNLFKNLSPRHSLGVGFGYSEYRFPTTYYDILLGPGDENYFERNRILPFFTYTLVYNYKFLLRENYNLSIQPSFLLEQYHETDYVPYAPKWPMSAAIDVQYRKKLFQNFNLLAGAHFRSSITRYNEKVFFSEHYPFAYAISFGFTQSW
ncbi:MAG: hypothetical protein KDC24_05815 [Saprospiraceae bacterium]|nr:hypothetical protein [Saprospiraceae bacterium]